MEPTWEICGPCMVTGKYAYVNISATAIATNVVRSMASHRIVWTSLGKLSTPRVVRIAGFSCACAEVSLQFLQFPPHHDHRPHHLREQARHDISHRNVVVAVYLGISRTVESTGLYSSPCPLSSTMMHRVPEAFG